MYIRIKKLATLRSCKINLMKIEINQIHVKLNILKYYNNIK